VPAVEVVVVGHFPCLPTAATRELAGLVRSREAKVVRAVRVGYGQVTAARVDPAVAVAVTEAMAAAPDCCRSSAGVEMAVVAARELPAGSASTAVALEHLEEMV
jgi:hypothetical protein